MSVIEQATGRWPLILEQLGVERSYIRKTNGPCPLCGGKDRYRFTDYRGKGGWYCSQCGPGDGMDLLQKLNGWSYREAAKEVERLIPGAMPVTPGGECENEKARRRLNTVRREARPAREVGEVVRYLEGRGLVVPPGLEAHPGMAYWHTDHEGSPYQVGIFPVMLGKLVLPSGKPVTYHRTYLDNGRKADVPGSVKKLMGKTRPHKGGAIRLWPQAEEIGIAEGIETAIAAAMLFRLPVWSVVSADGIAEFDPPEGVRSVRIFADHDWSYTGQAAAYAGAKRLKIDKEYRPRNLDVRVHIPPQEGDWADVLETQRMQGAA